jgi:hypothetical protein
MRFARPAVGAMRAPPDRPRLRSRCHDKRHPVRPRVACDDGCAGKIVERCGELLRCTSEQSAFHPRRAPRSSAPRCTRPERGRARLPRYASTSGCATGCRDDVRAAARCEARAVARQSDLSTRPKASRWPDLRACARATDAHCVLKCLGAVSSQRAAPKYPGWTWNNSAGAERLPGVRRWITVFSVAYEAGYGWRCRNVPRLLVVKISTFPSRVTSRGP